MITVYTGGTFDIPHIGHAIFFEECKIYFPTGYLVVALNTDEFIKRFKGEYPVFSYAEREAYIKAVPSVDLIVPNIGEEDSKITIEQVMPDVIAIGNDWLDRDYCGQMQFDTKWLSEKKIALCYLPRYANISTSLIKQKFLKGE
jgi:cytidyltransferase-like protein